MSLRLSRASSSSDNICRIRTSCISILTSSLFCTRSYHLNAERQINREKNRQKQSKMDVNAHNASIFVQKKTNSVTMRMLFAFFESEGCLPMLTFITKQPIQKMHQIP